MSRAGIKLAVLAIILVVAAFVGKPVKLPTGVGPSTQPSASRPVSERPSRQTWGRVDTLPDHFARHGRDFGARDADDYAAQAAAFLQRARSSGLPVKRDADGSLRIYDPATGTFGAYNRDGTTKTFFKPGDAHYFDRQPGKPVNLRSEP